MKVDKIRCIHRHTIDEHPACFAKGKVNYEISTDKEWVQITGNPWWTWDRYRIGYIDIETDGTNADFGTILTWAIKEKGKDVKHDIVTKEELFDGLGDKRIVNSLVEEMKRYKILIGYYSSIFDIPYIRTKALHYDINFPAYGEIYHFDLYYLVKSKLKLHRNSLSSVSNYLGVDGKTPIEWEYWRRAKYGDDKALKEVLSHNIGDVIALEGIHDKLCKFRKWTKTSI